LTPFSNVWQLSTGPRTPIMDHPITWRRPSWVPVHVGLLVRMTDKLARACRLAQGQPHQVEGEALQDTLLDLANYTVMTIVALEEGAGQREKQGQTADSNKKGEEANV
jgi:hypothetical protein